MPEATAAITASNVVKRYGGGRSKAAPVTAVDDVSLQVAAGEFFGILGPNGAGKTTLLEILEGLREPDGGTVTVLGQSVWPRNVALLDRIGVQLQASAFFERLTAGEQLQTFADLYGASADRIPEMLELVGLTDKAGTPAEKLSGGQAQRLSIACALVHDPDLVFLDEPTAALDPQARRNLWDLLREINARGKTVVLTTHYMDEAEFLCDRVAIMDTGRILQLGAPAELVRRLDAPVRISVDAGALPADRARTLVAALPGGGGAIPTSGTEISGTDASTVLTTRRPAPLLAALADADALSGLQVRGATLEDVFLALTGREYRA